MIPDPGRTEAPKEGAREAKRRETYLRIAEQGLALFLEHGYDATTLDAIAEAAGISRRTFFSYFKSKDEVLMAWSLNGWAELLDAVRELSPDEAPMRAVRELLVRRTAKYDGAQLRRIAEVMHSSPTLVATKQASFAQREQMLFQALCEVWRQPERRPALRLVAMVAVGAMRVAVEQWEAAGNRRPLHKLLQEVFEGLAAALE